MASSWARSKDGVEAWVTTEALETVERRRRAAFGGTARACAAERAGYPGALRAAYFPCIFAASRPWGAGARYTQYSQGASARGGSTPEARVNTDEIRPERAFFDYFL
ncbi:MAG: hypothetical protein Fur0019_00910 [Tibeticola sp.]